MTEPLEQNAEMVREMIAQLSGESAGYDEKALDWLDAYIDRNRDGFEPATKDKLIGMFGCFVGECCIRTYGGSWGQVDGNWLVVFDQMNNANPIGKVWKHFDNPDGGDSVAAFYRFLGEVRRGEHPSLTTPDGARGKTLFIRVEKKPPWWKFWKW